MRVVGLGGRSGRTLRRAGGGGVHRRARNRRVACRQRAGSVDRIGPAVGIRRRRTRASRASAHHRKLGLHAGVRARGNGGVDLVAAIRFAGFRCVLRCWSGVFRFILCRDRAPDAAHSARVSALYLVVDAALEIPPYQQIVEQIRAAIEREELQAHAPLPTVRQLAGDLGIAPNTVARAYAELQSEGWLVGDGRRGTRVAEHVPGLNRRTRLRNLRDATAHFVDSLRHRGFTHEEISTELARAIEP
ncbi:MAG: GntR family transcriptional regulator [Candidatus Eremiobacteraeota bacterium]|nr:GntR family transcriptional regulator [Candidatus Eremiobacteraeota bacterium]